MLRFSATPLFHHFLNVSSSELPLFGTWAQDGYGCDAVVLERVLSISVLKTLSALAF
jgi:hypothetical protein